MQWNARVLCALVAALLVACDGWPPYSERYQSRFLDNQSAFEELSAKLLATDYRRASLYVEGKTPMVIFHRDVYDEERGTRNTEIIKEVDASWTDLFDQTGVFDVERSSQAITFWALPTFDEHFALAVLKKDRVMSIRYVHKLAGPGTQWTCESGYKELACGRCSTPLVDGWSVRYSWAPDELAPEALDQYKKGKMSQEQYQERWLSTWNSCQFAGAKAIGYEFTEAKEFPR